MEKSYRKSTTPCVVLCPLVVTGCSRMILVADGNRPQEGRLRSSMLQAFINELALQLEELSLTGEEHVNAWAVGVEAIPEEWRALRCLSTLQLRGHTMLLVSHCSS